MVCAGEIGSRTEKGGTQIGRWLQDVEGGLSGACVTPCISRLSGAIRRERWGQGSVCSSSHTHSSSSHTRSSFARRHTSRPSCAPLSTPRSSADALSARQSRQHGRLTSSEASLGYCRNLAAKPPTCCFKSSMQATNLPIIQG